MKIVEANGEYAIKQWCWNAWDYLWFHPNGGRFPYWGLYPTDDCWTDKETAVKWYNRLNPRKVKI